MPLPSLPLRRGWVGAALLGAFLLSGCVPAPLRAQPNAQVRVVAGTLRAPLQTLTGEAVFAPPGPEELSVRTDRAAYVTVIVLPEQRWGADWSNTGAVVLPQVATQPGQALRVGVPPTLGFTQVYSVATLTPINLSGAAGRRSVSEVGRAVEAVTRALPAGSSNVAALQYRVSRLGTLRISASQPDARVSVAGRPVALLGLGTAVTVPNLPEGSVTVTVERGGFVTWSFPVTVEPDRVREVYAELRRPQPRQGVLRVTSVVRARVTVGGAGVGEVGPGQPLLFPWREGEDEVQLTAVESGARSTVRVRVRAGQVTSVSCTRSPEFVCTGG
ncbi:PEGA domain-containing protein [Deinococcus reticulitermitis]|uniref:PEGA domain-containing protein n=1 Tax=Deinococcus reticulitermitis TaxID=856736 RepID=A0A1H6WLX8_9DEIO|nr:PEGA domain-containing protein [Deinococcus reticulitermitis]SEJ13492.1 PEGA domain-containing protein [Deinococcus reticulitermitis]